MEITVIIVIRNTRDPEKSLFLVRIFGLSMNRMDLFFIVILIG